MERMTVPTSSLRSAQDMLELAADKLRTIMVGDTITVETYGRVLDARLEIAGVIGMLRPYPAKQEAA